ncbi:MAG: glycosyltransferase [archaeon]
MVKLSVVLPQYNDKKFVFKCIDSLLNQSFKDFELIVVDDGSNDGSFEELKKLKGIKLVQSKHVGRSKARNLGLSKAKGTIVFFAESDAIYSKNFLTDCVKHFKDKKVGGVIGKLEAWNLESVWVKCRAAELNSRFEGNYKPFTAWMYYTKEVQELGGFNSKLDVGEDVDLGQRIKRSGWKLVYERKAVWKHFEPPTIWKVWKRFWFRGREMPKYYKRNGFPVKVLLADFVAFSSLILGIFNPLIALIFVLFAVIQILMRIDYYNLIQKRYWLHLTFWLFSTMVVSKLARFYGLKKSLLFGGFK